MCCFRSKPSGGDWYRVLLGKNEWLQSHQGVHRCILCFLDFLLYLFYTLCISMLAFIVYLLSVGIGFPIIKTTTKEYPTNGEIWGFGFLMGFCILTGAMIVGVIVLNICLDWTNCITSNDYLLPEGGEKVEDTPDTNQIELESLSSEQIQ